MQYQTNGSRVLFPNGADRPAQSGPGEVDYSIRLVNDSSAGPKPKTLHEGQYDGEEIPTFRALQRSLKKINRFPLAQF